MSNNSQDPRAEVDNKEVLEADRRHDQRLNEPDTKRTHIKQACGHLVAEANKNGSQNGNGKNK